jgi:hypothetical protein
VGGKEEINQGSIMTFDISSYVPGGPSLNVTDALDIFHVASWALSNGFTDSDIFSAAWDNYGNTYIADAGANAVFKRDILTNALSVVDTFPPILNTVTPFPPYIDYVPTKIIHGPADKFYLCNLSGFPFLGGFSSVVSLDSTGVDSIIATGLTLAVDMEMDTLTGDIYALQFGRYDTNFQAIHNSAVITRLHTNGNIDTIAAGFGPSAAMMSDPFGGYYITEIYSGNLVHITFPLGIAGYAINNLNEVTAFPNPFKNELNIFLNLETNHHVSYEILDITGRGMIKKDLGTLAAGIHTIRWNGLSKNALLSKGTYILRVNSDSFAYNVKIIAE